MFHLVKYRYLFIWISILVIVPGLFFLFSSGLKVGIDFLGGTNAIIRPQRDVSIEEMRSMLEPFNLEDLQLVSGAQQNAGNTIVWVRLNTQVDGTVQTKINELIATKYPSAKVEPRPIPALNGKPAFTLLTMTGFDQAPSLDDIKATLKDLPKTTESRNITITGTTPTATATSSATATATTTPGATATATATPTANQGTIDVSVTDVAQGSTTQTWTILTRSDLKLDKIETIQASFLETHGLYFQLSSNAVVGASVAAQTTLNSFLAVLAASLFILAYIWFSFRKIAKAWRYGACAIIAMLHDVLLVLGIFSILGHFFNIQVDALFITALLTVVGFSVHDTIVVFDRIRENLHKRTVESFEQIVDASLVQTMARSLNTSLTVLFTLLTLTLFGGSGSVHVFTLTLLVGIFSGTYSSIFTASMLLVMWERHEFIFRFLGRKKEEPVSSKRANNRERELVRSAR